MGISDYWPTLKEQLITYKDLSASIRIHLSVYEKECIALIQEFPKVSFGDSQGIFDQLQKFQEELSCIKYGYEYDLNPALNDFVYAFERIDDLDTRRYWYNKLHNKWEWPIQS